MIHNNKPNNKDLKQALEIMLNSDWRGYCKYYNDKAKRIIMSELNASTKTKTTVILNKSKLKQKESKNAMKIIEMEYKGRSYQALQIQPFSWELKDCNNNLVGLKSPKMIEVNAIDENGRYIHIIDNTTNFIFWTKGSYCDMEWERDE